MTRIIWPRPTRIEYPPLTREWRVWTVAGCGYAVVAVGVLVAAEVACDWLVWWIQ